MMWGRWFLSDRADRAISPFFKITVSEYVRNRIQGNTLESLDEAEQLALGNAELLEHITEAREKLRQKRIARQTAR